MSTDTSHNPRFPFGVTISSTFKDLKDHRAVLTSAINSHGLHEVAMENDAAKLVDVIDSSLQMVRDGAGYVCIIGKRYGERPVCPTRNPRKLSIPELEFNDALRLERVLHF